MYLRKTESIRLPGKQLPFWRILYLVACVAGGVGGCSLAPNYHVPSVPTPLAYKEDDRLWQPASPSDMVPRGAWWTVYGDKDLDTLETTLDKANPSLAVALARYDAAKASLEGLRSGLFPLFSGSGGLLHERQSDNRPLRGGGQPNIYDADTLGIDIGYELDLWGRVRNEIKVGHAEMQAAKSDMASVQLSLEAKLAELYVRLRGADIQANILNDAVEAYEKALTLTRARFEGEIASQLDVDRAQAQLADAQAQASDVTAERALIEHAIASLIGQSASTVSLAKSDTSLSVPVIPVGIPTDLLQRRPDIAASERRVFASNAQIGVARAALFPSITLTATYGWQNTGISSLLTADNRYWALGPLSALSIFDGGLRRARVRAAEAEFDARASEYRAAVLSAFQQVEDELVLLNQLSREAMQENDAAHAAAEATTIATNRYREGTANFLDVVSAQTTSLQALQRAEQVHTRQLVASVDLIRALGGGWMASDAAVPGSVPGVGAKKSD